MEHKDLPSGGFPEHYSGKKSIPILCESYLDIQFTKYRNSNSEIFLVYFG